MFSPTSHATRARVTKTSQSITIYHPYRASYTPRPSSSSTRCPSTPLRLPPPISQSQSIESSRPITRRRPTARVTDDVRTCSSRVMSGEYCVFRSSLNMLSCFDDVHARTCRRLQRRLQRRRRRRRLTFDATCVWSLVVIARVTPTSRDDEAKGRPTRASIEHLVGILKYSRGCGGTTFGHVESHHAPMSRVQVKGTMCARYEPCVRIFAKTTRVCGRPTLIACKLLAFALLFAILLSAHRAGEISPIPRPKAQHHRASDSSSFQSSSFRSSHATTTTGVRAWRDGERNTRA